MVQLISSVPEFEDDIGTKKVWDWLKGSLRDVEGLCFYRHPVIGNPGSVPPDLAILARDLNPVAVRCLTIGLDEIEAVKESGWIIGGEKEDSPLLELGDFVVGLKGKFDRERIVRWRFEPKAVLALPLVSKAAFQAKFGTGLEQYAVIWNDADVSGILVPLREKLSDLEWSLAKSIFQAAAPISGSRPAFLEKKSRMGDAIREMEKRIALLDEEQTKVAIQIPPGPQRIRGLAGTGKTVLLAMKAANLHMRYPDRKILFTFHTQSLYNQARALISKMFRFYSDMPPDWDTIHVRHSWGSSWRAGVYSDVCRRQGAQPMDLNKARQLSPTYAFAACCNDALSREIKQEYDYVLVDEGQDFPKEFFRILYKLAKDPKCIYWAYDSLQSLIGLETPGPTELFGVNEKGMPLVSLEGNYPGEIERDLVLRKSYRCPRNVLMLAHAIGLGLYRDGGPVQMLRSPDAWRSVGYDLDVATFEKGKTVTIERKTENSPNDIAKIYDGGQPVTLAQAFDSKKAELQWVAKSIANDVNSEGVLPEQIVVISLHSQKARTQMGDLQAELIKLGVPSTIPGLVDDAAEFAEKGRVTLSTVYRAKGNEAPLIYIISFEKLYHYGEEIAKRNMAFTAISRSKAWVRISGTGKEMETANAEIGRITNDIPVFKFKFPDLERIRKLDLETSRKKKEVESASESVKTLMKVDKQALQAIDEEQLRRLKKILDEVVDER